MSLATLRKRAQAGVAGVGAGFTQPDDDWAPMLLTQDGRGEVTVVGFPVLDDREATVAILRAALRKVGAVRYALVLSSWAAMDDCVPRSENP